MPTQHQIGEAGPANSKIGGIPKIHYFDFFSKGRGQVLRLLFIDSGIAFTDIRYTFEEFPKDIKPTFTKQGGMNPTGSVPVIDLNGKILTQSYAIIRHFNRVLGNPYDGDDEEQMYQVDRLCDIAIDWRTGFVNAYFSDDQDKTYSEFCKGPRGNYMNALERHLEEGEFSQPAMGPFVIGKKFTYADMVIFQVLHDEELGKGDQKELKDYPRLKALYNGVMERPNVKAFFNSSEYKG